MRSRAFLSIAWLFLLAALFAMPASAIATTHWGIDYADFTINEELIMVESRSGFAEDSGFMRVEVVYALAQLEGIDPSNFVNTGFTDIAYGSEFAGIIKWGVDNGIVSGYLTETGTYEFRPYNTVTREQLCTFIYRYLNAYQIDYPVDSSRSIDYFTDHDKISSFASVAVTTLYSARIIDGNTNRILEPQGTVTLAEAAKMLTNLHAVAFTPEGYISVYVKGRATGAAVANASVFAYLSGASGSGLYPDSYGITNLYGIVSLPVSNANSAYALNAIGDDYGSTFSENTDLEPWQQYVFLELEYTDSTYTVPIQAFSPIYTWPHSSCSPECQAANNRICPYSYYYARYPQNFGWRYNGTLEFHTAADIASTSALSVTTATSIRSVFPTSAEVTAAREIPGMGNCVQLEVDGAYVTYAHLSSYIVTYGETIAARETVGYAGSTGLSSGAAVHLHYSLGSTETAFVSDTSPPETFRDPLLHFR